MIGKKHNKKTRTKLKKTLIGKGKGKKNSNWKGGKRNWWKRNCLERDNYTCQRCGINDKRVLEVDHIKSRANYPELKFDLDNGVTLCANCHAIKTYHEEE